MVSALGTHLLKKTHGLQSMGFEVRTIIPGTSAQTCSLLAFQSTLRQRLESAIGGDAGVSWEPREFVPPVSEVRPRWRF